MRSPPSKPVSALNSTGAFVYIDAAAQWRRSRVARSSSSTTASQRAGPRRAAVQIARSHGARRVILAVPVARESVHELSEVADAVVAVSTPSPFDAIGAWYEHFTQTTDDEVRTLLDAAAPVLGTIRSTTIPSITARSEKAHVDDDPVGEDLPFDDEVLVASEWLRSRVISRSLAAARAGLVLFAHGSGSSRHSPRNQFVAAAHARSRARDLAVRPLVTRRGARARQRLRRRAVGGAVARGDAMGPTPTILRRSADRLFRGQYRGGAALWAASEDPTIAAVVSRGGRPDLASLRLHAVAHRPCSLSGATTRSCSGSTKKRLRAFSVSTESRSCRARRICSRNRELSKQPPMPLRTGSFGTCPASPPHTERRSRRRGARDAQSPEDGRRHECDAATTVVALRRKTGSAARRMRRDASAPSPPPARSGRRRLVPRERSPTRPECVGRHPRPAGAAPPSARSRKNLICRDPRPGRRRPGDPPR